MTRMRRRLGTAAVAAAVVALVFAVAACGGGVKNSTVTSSATTGTTGTTSASAGGQTTTGTATIAESGTTRTTSEAATTAVAQQTVKAPNTKDGTVDIAILGLAVQGQLATLTARFTPHFPSAAPDDSISLYDMSDNAMDPRDVSLVDPVGLKRYLVVQDANNVALGADEVNTEAVNNSPVIAHWTFAAPPPEVTKLDVDLGPFPPFNDIPVSR